MSRSTDEDVGTSGRTWAPVSNASATLSPQAPARSCSERTNDPRPVRRRSFHQTNSDIAHRNAPHSPLSNGIADEYSDRQVRTKLPFFLSWSCSYSMQRYGTSQQSAAYSDFDSSTDLQRVAKMVEGMKAIEADFEDVLKKLNSLLRMSNADTEKIQPLCDNWIDLRRVRDSYLCFASHLN